MIGFGISAMIGRKRKPAKPLSTDPWSIPPKMVNLGRALTIGYTGEAPSPRYVWSDRTSNPYRGLLFDIVYVLVFGLIVIPLLLTWAVAFCGWLLAHAASILDWAGRVMG